MIVDTPHLASEYAFSICHKARKVVLRGHMRNIDLTTI